MVQLCAYLQPHMTERDRGYGACHACMPEKGAAATIAVKLTSTNSSCNGLAPALQRALSRAVLGRGKAINRRRRAAALCAWGASAACPKVHMSYKPQKNIYDMSGTCRRRQHAAFCTRNGLYRMLSCHSVNIAMNCESIKPCAVKFCTCITFSRPVAYAGFPQLHTPSMTVSVWDKGRHLTQQCERSWRASSAP